MEHPETTGLLVRADSQEIVELRDQQGPPGNRDLLEQLVLTDSLGPVGSLGILDKRAVLVQLDQLVFQETTGFQDQLVQPANRDQLDQADKLVPKDLRDSQDH